MAVSLILAGGLVSCEKNEGKNEEEPREIPFTEYSLSETDCRWVNTTSDKVIIINSNEELKKHIECEDDNYPAINFSKQTLLLASGATTHNVIGVNSHLKQYSKNSYELYVEVTLGTATVAQGWYISILTEKINERSILKTNVKTNH
jgi:hypothetical protein